LVITSGLAVFQALLEEDRVALCGRPHQPQEDRSAFRHGFDRGQVVLGGRKVQVRKPRVRSADGERELVLPLWEHVAAEDPLNERVLEQMLLGVSTRKYARSLEPLPAATTSRSVSRSAVSRRFVARTTAQLDSFISRPLDHEDYPVLMVDATGFGDHLLVVVLGIDASGRKRVLGVEEGSTENATLCRRLLSNLVERGLHVERARLVVVDGGKGVRRAVKEVFGTWAVVQRCQVHKLRNVLEHLPENVQPWVRATMRQAYAQGDAETARRQLQRLASRLETDHPGAAASLREGLEETLTILTLGLTGALRRTLRSTNPIENLNGTLKRVARNVKRWRGGTMALRWAGTGLIEAERKFRRIRGHRDLPSLLAALDALVPAKRLDKKQAAA
jgi:transposase-like protein